MKRPITFLICLSLGALAQEPPPPGSNPTEGPAVPAPVPTINPAPAPAAAPSEAAVSSVPAGPPDPNAIAYPQGGGIEEPNMSGLRAAQLYEEHTGKRVIMSAQVSQAEVFFVQRGPMTHKMVVDLLTKSLLGDGLAFIPDPLDPDIVRLQPSGPINGTGAIPKGYINDEFELPTTDELVTYRMEFQYLKPEDALKVFQSALGQLSASGNITAVPNAASLMITENSNLIRQMIKIQKDIDLPTRIAEKWVDVTYGDVDEIAERMNEIYNDQASSRGGASRTARTNTPPAPGSVPGATTAGEDVPIKIIGVRRTSRILLVGRPTDLIAAEAMVKSFDIPSSGKNRMTFRLRYLRVNDFLPIAEDAITVILGDSSAANGPGGAANNSLNNRASTNSRTNTNSVSNSRTTGQTAGGGGAGGNRASIQEQDIPTEPVSSRVGNTLLVGDNVANTIIVNGPPHHIELVRDLIEDLDTESQQVALSAVVGSYSIGNGLNFGVDLAQILDSTNTSIQLGGRSSFGSGAPVLAEGTLNDLSQMLTAQGLAGRGVSLYGLVEDEFGFFVNALENTNKFKTLERTVLTTRNNRVAQLSSGQRIAIPSSTFVGTTTGGQNTNVEYRDVTLELLIQPLINDDNKVTLEISLVRDSVGNDRDVGELIVPDINTQQLSTSITLDDGSVVILGGVITETERDGNRGLPILSRIPGIGRLFGSTELEGERAELVIMIQPRIIKSNTEMDAFRSDYEQSTEFSGDVIENFPPRGVLPEEGTMPDGEVENATPSARNGERGSGSSSAQEKRSVTLRSRSGRPGPR